MIKQLIPLALASVSMEFAQPGRGFRATHMAREQQLNLTTEQQEQITKLRTAYQTQVIDLRADLQKFHLQRREQMGVDQPNRRAINGTVERIAAKRGELDKLEVNHSLDVRGLLTAEQRQLFDSRSFKRGLGAGRGQRRSRGFGRW